MDKILEMAFEPRRWEAAIMSGYLKDIPQAELRSLCDPRVRVEIYRRIKNGTYMIAPPRTAKIPKDEPGEYRVVYINENIDRVFLSIMNDLLFDICRDMIHKNCRSYQRGTSCGDVVQDISKYVSKSGGECVGFKADLSKYFDSVPIEFIDEAFDRVEQKHGKSAAIDVLRAYYHQDLFFDVEHDYELTSKYQSLKQGCAVASWLADVLLYDIDEALTKMLVIYQRYSDDIGAFGPRWDEALILLEQMLNAKGLKLNPKKVERLDKNHWFKFLGFSIKGSDISLSSSGIKKFQNEIKQATYRNVGMSQQKAMKNVYDVLYKGPQGYSWAKRVLRVINVKSDIDKLNGYVMDCIRATVTGKHKVGGLGFVKDKKDGCIDRGKGQNVKANKEKIPQLDGYYTIRCMQNLLQTSTALFEVTVSTEM